MDLTVTLDDHTVGDGGRIAFVSLTRVRVDEQRRDWLVLNSM
mgnify:CR=1 FL=1